MRQTLSYTVEKIGELKVFYLFAPLLFLPSVTFGLLEAEIFPWALLISIFLVRKLNMMTLILCSILLISYAYTLLNAVHLSEGSTDLLRSFAAYLNFIIIFDVLLQQSDNRILDLVSLNGYIFVGLVVLGLAQHFGLIEFLHPILSSLTPRASSSALSEIGGRGVTLLSSEPARAGVEITLMYVLVRIGFKHKKITLLIDVLFLAFIFILVRSASGVAFSLITVAVLNARKILVIFPFLVLISPVLFFFNELSIPQTGRALILINSMLMMGSINEIIFFAANESGHRLIALYSFINSGFNNLVGHGLGLWRISSMQSVLDTGLNFKDFRYFWVHGGGELVPFRGPGVISNLMLDIGLVGTSIFVLWIFVLISKLKIMYFDKLTILAIFFIKIFLFGSLGTPLPWIVLALSLRYLTIMNDGIADKQEHFDYKK